VFEFDAVAFVIAYDPARSCLLSFFSAVAAALFVLPIWKLFCFEKREFGSFVALS